MTSHSALVWFRTAGRTGVRIEWAPEDKAAGDSAGSPSSRELAGTAEVTTSKERDFTATVLLDNLIPATSYRYQVMAERRNDRTGMHEAATGRFTTASPEMPETVTFLWGGDLGGQHRCRDQRTGFTLFEHMLRRRPTFAVLLGDLIYGDDRCPSPPNVPGSDFLASTLDEFRAKHRYQRGDPALRRFLAAIPVYAIWDDHEVRNNFAGPSEPLMPLGRQAFLEYWPIGSPPEDPYRFYRKIRRGADLELFILDTRQYRSKNAEPDGEGKTMLGAAQRAWILDELARSTATWKVIATSVPLSNQKPGTLLAPGNDSWARAADGTGFLTELRAIVNEILGRRIRNVVWLAADVHYAQVNAYDPDGDGMADFHEFICGPLSAAPVKPVPPDPALRPTTLYSESGFMNFGVVTVEGGRLSLEIVDEAGTSRFAQSFAAQRP
ncbi:MAG: alkaline phosphatase D family protein [Nitrospirae bacterium]|nr:alkaline phosphatase D family protein [Nitrospirota bacterium]